MNSNDDVRNSINIMRRIINERKKTNIRSILNEEVTEAEQVDSVPYSDRDEIMTSIKSVCKTQFGADFSRIKNPMLYYPKDGDVTLNGEIASLNDAKFQFRYKDASNGCYVWLSPLQLTDETLRKLQIIYGVYKNWRNELDSSEDIKPMEYKAEQ